MVCFCICFPGETTVITKDQGVKRLEELISGDKVLTLGMKSQTAKHTPFYAWGHREPETMAEFLVLTVGSGHQLKISRNHLLFVAGKGGRKIAKPAEKVCKGDNLVHMAETGGLELLPVIEIRTELLKGVYAPFTTSGHFLADGFLVACYAEVGENFNLAHAALAPLRLWYRIFQHKIKKSNNKNPKERQEGIHSYAVKLMKIRNFLH